MEVVSTHEVDKISSQIVVVHPRVTMWSARKKLHLEDTRASAEDLPPLDVISLGSKFVIDKAVLADFRTIYRKAHAACYRHGARFLGGYAVPAEAVPVLRMHLDALATWHAQALEAFALSFDQAVVDWRTKHCAWIDAIGKATLNKASILEKFSFRVSYFRADAAEMDAPMADALLQEYRGLGGQLLIEIAEEAADILARTFRDQRGATKESASVRTVRRLLGLQEKMRGLAFLDPTIEPLCNVIGRTLEDMPTEGRISGTQLLALTGMVQVMADPDRMLDFGTRVLNGKHVEVEQFVHASTMYPQPAASLATAAQMADAGSQEPAVLPFEGGTLGFPIPGGGAGIVELTF